MKVLRAVLRYVFEFIVEMVYGGIVLVVAISIVFATAVLLKVFLDFIGGYYA